MRTCNREQTARTHSEKMSRDNNKKRRQQKKNTRKLSQFFLLKVNLNVFCYIVGRAYDFRIGGSIRPHQHIRCVTIVAAAVMRGNICAKSRKTRQRNTFVTGKETLFAHKSCQMKVKNRNIVWCQFELTINSHALNLCVCVCVRANHHCRLSPSPVATTITAQH